MASNYLNTLPEARAASARKLGLKGEWLQEIDSLPPAPSEVKEQELKANPDASPYFGSEPPPPQVEAPPADPMDAPFSQAEKEAADPLNEPFSDAEKKAAQKELEPAPVRQPDMNPLKDLIHNALRAAGAAPLAIVSDALMGSSAPDTSEQHKADSFLQAIEAGLQISTSGLLARGKKPSVILPEDAPRAFRIAANIAELAGDAPAMIVGGAVGGIGGAAAGTAVAPGAGTAVGGVGGAGAGGMALPTALRKILMDHYEKGDIKDFGDFWERLSSTFIETAKSAAVGAATMGAGAKVKAMGMAAGPITLGATRALTAKATMAEVATMVTVGKALEGQAPNLDDFLDAALVVGALHATGSTATKLRKIYAETGTHPAEVARESETNPVLKQELLSSDTEIPSQYKVTETSTETKPVETAVEAPAEAPKLKLAPAPELFEQSSVLRPETPEQQKIKIEAFQRLMENAPDLQSEAGQLGSRAPEPKRSEAAQAIVDQLATQSRTSRGTFNNFDTFYTDIVDRTHPIYQFEEAFKNGKMLSADKSPYKAIRALPGVSRMVGQFLKYSPFEYKTGKNVGKPLMEIIKPFKADLPEFEAYLAAKRAVELEGRGIKSGLDLEQAKALLKEGGAKYDKAAQEIVEYQNHALAYLKDSGILSEKAFKEMVKANQAYVPFYRLMEEGEVVGRGKGKDTKNPVKAIEGSDRKIIRPLESIVKNTEMYIALAERNRVGVTMAELAAKDPDLAEFVFKKQKTPMRELTVTEPEITKFFEEHGIDATPEAFSIFRPGNIVIGNDEIAVFRNGKREIYKTHPEFANAIKNMDEGSANIFMKLMAFPARALRAGTVLTPEFATRNFTKDQLAALGNSQNRFIPFYDSLGALGHLLKKDEVYQAFLKSGGAMAEMHKLDDFIKRDIYGLNKETGIIDRTWNVVRTPVDLLAAFSETLEEITRIAEFKKGLQKDSSFAGMREAGFNAREVTVDMARTGAKTRGLNQLIAFWNIGGIQGTDRFIRAYKADPIGMSAKLFSAVTVPSILLWYANHEDPRYRDIPDWEKNTFWHIMTKEHIYRVPKPHLEGLIFGSLVERSLDAMFTDNPKAFKNFGSTLGSGLLPGYMPTAAAPIIEHATNHVFFTGGRVVPASLEKVLPQYQYTEYTTQTARALGKMVAAVPGMRENSFSSPMVLENYARSWSGNLGMYFLRTLDFFGENTGVFEKPQRPTAALADIPFVKAFVTRYPSANAQSIQDFYENFDESEKVRGTIKHLARTGDFKSMEKELMLEANQEKIADLKTFADSIAKQGAAIHMIYRDKTMHPDEKRQLIDGLYNGMISTAQRGNQIIRELEKITK